MNPKISEICRLVLVVLVLWMGCARVSVAQVSAFTASHYQLKLSIDPVQKSIHGEEVLRLTLAEQTQDLQLDAEEIQVSDLHANSALESWKQDKEHLLMHFRQPLAAHQKLILRLRYHGQPKDGLTWAGGGAQALYDSPHWMVCEMKPASLATLDLEAHFPATMRMAASGVLLREGEKNGEKISVWSQRQPVVPFVLGFVVGNFQEVSMMAEGVRLRLLSEKHSPAQMKKIFAVTPNALRFFTEHSGVALQPAVYTQVLTSGSPMQELAQMTVLPVEYGDELLGKDEKDVALLVHELAHQWWGIRVPCADWDDFWLNEGMANFMADAFLEKEYGKAAYQQAVEVHRNIYLKGKEKGKDHALCLHGWKKPSDASGWVAYHKGAYVLSLLREKMGDDAFWRGLRDYTSSHQGRLVTSKDLQTSMEKASGCSLQAFFDQWVYA